MKKIFSCGRDGRKVYSCTAGYRFYDLIWKFKHDCPAVQKVQSSRQLHVPPVLPLSISCQCMLPSQLYHAEIPWSVWKIRFLYPTLSLRREKKTCPKIWPLDKLTQSLYCVNLAFLPYKIGVKQYKPWVNLTEDVGTVGVYETRLDRYSIWGKVGVQETDLYS